MPFSLESRVITRFPKHMADGRDISRHLRGPCKVGIIPHAGLGWVHTRVYGRPRWRADGVNRVLVTESNAFGLQSIVVGED